MSEQKPSRQNLSLAADHEGPSKAERGALELKIAELTGIAEYLSQTIAISQGHAERLQKEVEDLIRHRQQAENELQTQEETNANMRQEIHRLEMEIKKDEATISAQQERVRILAETIDTAERRSKHAIEAFNDEKDSKLKAIKYEFETIKERFTMELEAHRNQTQAEIRQLTEETEQSRKKQQRALEIEYQDMKKKAEDTVAKLLQDGRSKNEALIKATEATALEVHRESESATKRLIQEANQKAADVVRAAQHEAEEVRRRTHNAEVSFLKEKNSGLAELKLMVANAKEEAQAILSAAMKEASDIQQRVEKDNEIKIAAVNTKVSIARKTMEKEKQESVEKTHAELLRQSKEHEAALFRKMKDAEEHIANERKRVEDEARSILANARERAQAIVETANNEKNYKYEELKALERSMFHTARQSAATITHDAEHIALEIVEEARSRTRNVESIVEGIIAQATDDGAKIRAKADAYFERIKRELPSPENWDAELSRIRQQEQDRLQAVIEPTVKNYLKAIDMAINEIFMELPSKYQTNKIIQDFAEAIVNIQHKKNNINFGDMIPRMAVVQSVSDMPPVSHPPMKKTS